MYVSICIMSVCMYVHVPMCRVYLCVYVYLYT